MMVFVPLAATARGNAERGGGTKPLRVERPTLLSVQRVWEGIWNTSPGFWMNASRGQTTTPIADSQDHPAYNSG